jgi:hypothetical protein
MVTVLFSLGGIYTQEMPKGTDILILPVGKGEKFKYAERWKMKCIKPSWIKCCLEKGYAVPYENYIVHSAETKCSTPVNTGYSEFFETIVRSTRATVFS